MAPTQTFRDGLYPLAVRALVAAVVAGIVWWSWCLFTARSESGTVFLTVLGGICGGCVGTFGPAWKAGRLVSNAIAGVFLSLILYFCVRGIIVRVAAPPCAVRACGVAAMSFLGSLSMPSGKTWTEINLVARRAVVVLAFGLVIRGIVLLCR